ncbi:oligosaccharide flippase family protein [Deinococcus enclensis]|uniref:PST family polysaccharide transporter n=1 Tax=Deinococcus enclensis TaxID=1049582 RepID=A0ABT9MBV3_9DEIO|nr:oligosaccharide flippase family protein [Deinococcus enclensis]MDP9764001.1 PST family polysaccharide transporter [Deinococcus enclensis]
MSSSKKNVILFYLSKLIQMSFPLIITMFVARKYDKSEFGYILVCQSIAALLAAVIEYGFNYSGARDLGVARTDEMRIKDIFGVVNAAKLILLFVVTFIYLTIVHLMNIPDIYWLGTYILIISQGFNLLWFFQGTDNVKTAIIYDIILKSVFLFIVLVDNVNSGLFITLLGISQFLTQIILFIFTKQVFTPIKYYSKSLEAIRSGLNLFIFRIGSLIYGGATNMILAVVMPPQIVANYGGADKLFRAAASLTTPIGDAFFSNLSHQYSKANGDERRLFTLAVKIITLVVIVIFFIGEIFAEDIVRLILGNEYFESIKILKILLFSVPLIGLGTIIFILYLLPRGQDRYFAIATTFAGAWTLVSTFFLVPKFGVLWMAYTVVISEALVCAVGILAILINLRGRRND